MSRDELQDRLRSLARVIPQEASAEVESRVRARFRQQRSHTPRLLRYVAGMAASLALVCGLYWLASRGSGRHRESERLPKVEQTTEFVALPYAQSDVPLEQAVIVRVNISASQLTAMGVPLTTSWQQNVRADLLVGQDGVARAVRLVP